MLAHSTALHMKILCAPDSFKESISAVHAAQAMAEGVADAHGAATVDQCPVGDGGEGTMEALQAALHGRVIHQIVTGPLGQPIDAPFCIARDGQRAVVELAQASGLALVPRNQRDPTKTTTFGTGELIAA